MGLWALAEIATLELSLPCDSIEKKMRRHKKILSRRHDLALGPWVRGRWHPGTLACETHPSGWMEADLSINIMLLVLWLKLRES